MRIPTRLARCLLLLISALALAPVPLAADPDPDPAAAPEPDSADDAGPSEDGESADGDDADGESDEPAEPARSIREYRNLTFTRAGVANRALRINVYLPPAPAEGAADGPYKTVVMFHGGSFMAGNPEVMASLCRDLVGQGFACASAQYRLVPYQLPDMVSDAKAAVRWLRAHADTYHLDVHNFAALGHSAGGALSLTLAVTPNEPDREPGGAYRDQSSAVQAAVSLAGVADFGRAVPDMLQRLDRSPLPAKDFLLGDWSVEKASPSCCVDRGDAPILIIHDKQDGVVPHRQSELMAAACKEHGVPCHLCSRDGIGHSFIFNDRYRADTVREIVAFLQKHLTHTPAEAEDDF